MNKRISPSAPLGAGLVILSSVFYASYGIWTKLMGDFFDGYTASALRSVLVVIILTVAALVTNGLEPFNLKKNWKYIVGMTCASLFIWGPLYYAILRAGVGISLTITYASILIGTFFFGRILAQEKITRDKMISAFLGIIGLMLIFSPTFNSATLIALLAALISGLSSSANIVLAKQIHYKATQSTLVMWVTSIIANIIMAFILKRTYPTFNWQIEWFYLILFAVASVVASWSLVQGTKSIEAGAAGVLGLLEIVFGVLFGVLLFREHPSVLTISGMFVIMIATAIPYIKDFNAKRGTLD